jgi:RNA polymerase sigma-70 factor (ECF subfamily)
VIYGFIYYKTFHKETAEDLTSETFFKALTHIQTVDPSRSFQSWLYKIAQNSVIDHFRRERYMENIDDIWDVADGANVETDASVALEIRALRKELHNLSRRERDIVIMRVWQELSYREIAEILGKSEASCKMSYSRVVSKLKQTVPVALGIPSLDNNGTN